MGTGILKVLRDLCPKSEGTSQPDGQHAEGMVTIVSIGQVLQSLYRHKFLPQPESSNEETIRGHVSEIFKALDALDIWSSVVSDDQKRIWAKRTPLLQLLALPIHRIQQPEESQSNRGSSIFSTQVGTGGRSFRADDLNNSSLKKLGKVKIIFTSHSEHHMDLHLGGHVDDDASSDGEGLDARYDLQPTLKLYWFDTEKSSWLTA